MLGEYQEIDRNLLMLDFSYQRQLNHNRVEKMVADFDDSLLGTLTVAKRSNGTFAVIDGQHRFAALKIKNYKLIPCLVYPEMSVQKEAQMFADLNSCKQKNSALELFWALVGAKDEKQLQILQTVEKNGFTIAKRPDSKQSQKYSISAIGLVHKIEKQYGMDILDNVLKLITETWPGRGEALSGQLLGGLAIFIKRFGDNENFNPDTAKKKFLSLSLETILAKARNQAKIYNSDVSHVIADILFESYNKNLKQTKKLKLDISFNK